MEDFWWQIAVGICAGAFVAAGLFTFIVSLGIVTRLAQVTRTAGFVRFFESCFIAGGITGNLLWLYPQLAEVFGGGQNTGAAGLLFHQFSEIIILAFIGFFCGLFTGCLIGAVAEILDAFPIFFRRLKLKHGIALIVLTLALGKFLGIIVQFFL